MKTVLSFLAAFILATTSFSQVCTGDFVFDTQAELDQFAIDNPTCDSIVGDVSINMYYDNDPILQLNALQNITTIVGSLVIGGSGDLTGLNNLNSVGELRLYYFAGDISPLENLQNISSLFVDIGDQNDLHIFDDITTLDNLRIGLEGYVNWTVEPDLHDIFPNLTTVNEYLNIGGIGGPGQCDTLTGFDALTHVGILEIAYWELYMNHFDAMHNLQTIGTFWNYQWFVNSLSGFENVQSIGNVEMSIVCDCDLPDFESLHQVNTVSLFNFAQSQPDFPSLTQVNGDILAMGNANSLGFVSLETVQGNLEIIPDLSETYSFFDEIHLDSLREVYGNFSILGTGVDDIDFLSNLDSVGGTMTLAANFNLSDCEIDYLCQQIPIEPDMFIIENNIGCASPQEVLASCGNSYVAGQVFYDLDCDGIFNNDDLSVANPIIVNELNMPMSGSNSLGEYFVPLNDNTTSTFSVLGMPLFSSTSHTITTGNSAEAFDNLDFPLCPTVNLHDIGVSASVNSSFRPGFNAFMQIAVHNYSMYTEDVQLELNLDNMPGVTASYIYNDGTALGNSIIWNLEDISPFSIRWVTVRLHLNSTTPLGQVLTSSLSATLQPTTLEDINLSNNTNSYSYTVVGSYDPNDISVNIQALNYEDFPSEGLTLDYLIRFQNTGTAPAEFVRVTDIIEEDLNLGSIEILSSSHEFQLSFDENHEVEWLFENIQLPDSTTDLEGSQGYIHYRIKTNPDVMIDDVIENTAAIYFDYNEQVFTNTATTEFYICDEVLTIGGDGTYCEGDDISIYGAGDWDSLVWTLNEEEVGNEWIYETQNALAGNYTFHLTAMKGYCVYEVDFEVLVSSEPINPVITQNGNTLTATGEGMFNWTIDGVYIADYDNTIEITESGTYAVYIQNFECFSELASEYFEYVGIQELTNDFVLFPNPVNELLNIRMPEPVSSNTLVVTDMIGKEVFRKQNFSGQSLQIDCSLLQPGVYALCLGNLSCTFIKE